MAVARINFSHGTYADHAQRIELVRRQAADLGRSVAIMADLQGPKLRVGLLPEGGIPLLEGETVILRNEETSSEPSVIPLPHPEVLRDVRSGDQECSRWRLSGGSAGPRQLPPVGGSQP